MKASWIAIVCVLAACQGRAPEVIEAESPPGGGSWEKGTACIRTVAEGAAASRCLGCHPEVEHESSLSPEPTLKMAHALHLGSPLLRFRCSHCHRRVDLAEDSAAALRRQVSAEAVCLRCHGPFPTVHNASWEEMRKKQPKLGCASCHAPGERHGSPFLNRREIEAKSDACYTCHGGRALFTMAGGNQRGT